MPTYDYSCPACGYRDEFLRKLAQLETPLECPKCGEVMARQVSMPMVRGDYEAYDCPITGNRIEGRKAHQENLKRHGCRLLEPGETRDYIKATEKRQQDTEREVERIVEKTAHEMGFNT